MAFETDFRGWIWSECGDFFCCWGFRECVKIHGHGKGNCLKKPIYQKCPIRQAHSPVSSVSNFGFAHFALSVHFDQIWWEYSSGHEKWSRGLRLEWMRTISEAACGFWFYFWLFVRLNTRGKSDVNPDVWYQKHKKKGMFFDLKCGLRVPCTCVSRSQKHRGHDFVI